MNRLFTFPSSLSVCLLSSLVVTNAFAQDPPVNAEIVRRSDPDSQLGIELFKAADGTKYIAAALGSTDSFAVYEVLAEDSFRELARIPVSPGRVCREVRFFELRQSVYLIAAEESKSYSQIVHGPGAKIYRLSDDKEIEHVSTIDREVLVGVHHNQALIEIGGTLYYFTSSGEVFGGPDIFVFNLNNPRHPRLVTSFPSYLPQLTCPGRPPGTQRVYGLEAQYSSRDGKPYLYVLVQPDATSPCPVAYFALYDISEPGEPTFLGASITNVFDPAWLPHIAAISKDGTLLYMTCEWWGAPLRVYDISNPDPSLAYGPMPLLAEIPTRSPLGMYHDVQILEDEFLVATAFEHGTSVFHLGDPVHPLHIAQLDTSDGTPWNFGIVGNWGSTAEVRRDALGFPREILVYAGDMQRGLTSFRLTPLDVELRVKNRIGEPRRIEIEASLRNMAPGLTANVAFQIRVEAPGLFMPLQSSTTFFNSTGVIYDWRTTFPVPPVGLPPSVDVVAHFFEIHGRLALERRVPVQIL